MPTIGIIKQKGGSSATMTTCLLAAHFDDSTIWDLDTVQGSATWWVNMRKNQGLHARAGDMSRGMEVALENLPDGTNIIDTAGGINKSLVYAISASDFVIIPTNPSAADLLSLDAIHDIVMARAAGDKNFSAHVLFGRVPTHPSVAKELITEATGFITEAYPRFQIAKTHIRERIAYQRAWERGLSPTELNLAKDVTGDDGKVKSIYDQKTADEVASFTSWVEEIL